MQFMLTILKPMYVSTLRLDVVENETLKETRKRNEKMMTTSAEVTF